jgi:hypothetical protein
LPCQKTFPEAIAAGEVEIGRHGLLVEFESSFAIVEP